MLNVRVNRRSGEAFAKALLETHSIAVRQGESLGSVAAGHIRVAMTIANDLLIAALQTLRDLAMNAPGRSRTSDQNRKVVRRLKVLAPRLPFDRVTLSKF